MPLALADLTAVRIAGALPVAPAPGAVTDNQIQAALQLASRRMVDLVSLADYFAVGSFSDSELQDSTPDAVTGRTKAQKQQDYINAECYFAIAYTSPVTAASKMNATGIPQSIQIGREVKTFAPLEEADKSGGHWEDEAFRCLAPYLSFIERDVNGAAKTFSNKRKTLHMAAIGGGR